MFLPTLPSFSYDCLVTVNVIAFRDAKATATQRIVNDVILVLSLGPPRTRSSVVMITIWSLYISGDIVNEQFQGSTQEVLNES
jgi:hypothetical protein